MYKPVYVVVSDTIDRGQVYHGIHGVYTSKDSAQAQAMSTIMGIAEHHKCNITKDDITIEYDDHIYTSNKVDIVVSCIEQQIL